MEFQTCGKAVKWLQLHYTDIDDINIRVGDIAIDNDIDL